MGSSDPAGRRQPVSPDAALCAACQEELFAPDNRRRHYPFITCTDCGPRFTVIEAMPYDRERTSMACFTMCPECQARVRHPGRPALPLRDQLLPELRSPALVRGRHRRADRSRPSDAIRWAAVLLAASGTLALRGFGGFHLAVDATSSPAVARLRARKCREAKPFAVMVRTLRAARRLADIGEVEAELLESTARPVVLVKARPDNGLAPEIAPGLDTIGLMLPSTPLHHLLLEAAGHPLVMTSGNISDEPIAIGNDEARDRLSGIADGFLFHDREIVARYDDSVVRVVAGEPLLLRRARGIAPLPIPLPIAAPRPVLAVGADLKNTFTLVDGDRAYVSQHIGDLESFETQQHFDDALLRFRTLFQISPEVIARDLHPGYHSSRIAEAMASRPLLTVQHHHAHIAAVLAEHGETGPAIGVAYDGTGYGDDGQVWGAEILLADLLSYQRFGQMRYLPLPGGDLAARQPWRSALGALSLEPSHRDAFARAFAGVPPQELRVAEQQLTRRLNCPLASSMGRLFDAASAVLGVRQVSGYEGHAAMELESLAGGRPGQPLPFPIRAADDGPWMLDPLPLLVELGRRRQAGTPVPQLAADFHESVVAATEAIVEATARRTNCRTVALGGGVFQNARLIGHLAERLTASGFRVLLPRALSPNDGAISYGQAAIAAALLTANKDAT